MGIWSIEYTKIQEATSNVAITEENEKQYVRLQPTYSSSDNLAPSISRVLIGRHLIFCSLTSPTCRNSPRKCTPVNYKVRQKAGFPIVTHTTSEEYQKPQGAFLDKFTPDIDGFTDEPVVHQCDVQLVENIFINMIPTK